jgi:uroporphyrinogen-III synthase
MTVLITRPAASGRLLADRLTGLGYRTYHEPLLTITPVTGECPDVSHYHALIITSANALAMLSAQMLQSLRRLPCYCVGDMTAAAARAAGFTTVCSAQGAGADLAQLIMQRIAPGRRLLHACGLTIDPAVQTLLAEAGYQVTSWPVYQAVPQTALSEPLHQALHKNIIKAALFFSPRTAQLFMSLTAAAPLAGIAAYSLSPAVAVALAPWPGSASHVAADPTEAALIACLQRHYPALLRHD